MKSAEPNQTVKGSHGNQQFTASLGDKKSIPQTYTKSKQDEEWRTTLILNDKSVLFKLDTGTGCNVISKKVYGSVSKNPPWKTLLRLEDMHRLNPCGKANLLSEYKGRYRVLEFIIVDGNVQNSVPNSNWSNKSTPLKSESLTTTLMCSTDWDASKALRITSSKMKMPTL